MEFSAESQKRKSKKIQIKSESIRNTELMSNLMQKNIGKDEFYMRTDDAKKMAVSIAQTIIAREITDEGFVDSEQVLSVAKLLENLMQSQIVSSSVIESEQSWGSVFWQGDAARPDQTTRELNSFTEELKNEIRSKRNLSQSDDVSISYDSELNIVGIVSGGQHLSVNDSTVSEHTMEKYKNLIKKSKGTVQVTGNKFSPKTMNLTRINTSAFKVKTVFDTVQVVVSRKLGVYRSNFNLPPLDTSGGLWTIRERSAVCGMPEPGGFCQATGAKELLYPAFVEPANLTCPSDTSLNCTMCQPSREPNDDVHQYVTSVRKVLTSEVFFPDSDWPPRTYYSTFLKTNEWFRRPALEGASAREGVTPFRPLRIWTNNTIFEWAGDNIRVIHYYSGTNGSRTFTHHPTTYSRSGQHATV